MTINPETPSDSVSSILETLIGFPTVSRDSNLGMIEWVRDYLQSHGVESQLIYDATGKKANLLATLGGGDKPGMLLSGHSDVVPIDGQDWTMPAFTATTVEGKTYGRGSADMKGFIAVVLSIVPQFLASDARQPLYLAFSYDEEVGCIGVHSLIEALQKADIKPRGCIVGEPTNMQVIVGHKGGSVHVCDVKGREMHSALAPYGVNAIEYAARIINKINDISNRLRETEKRHTGYEIPYSTLQTGVIQGGVAANIVAKECNFRFDIRCLPWTQVDDLLDEIKTYANEELLPRMREIAPESDISFSKKGEVPAFSIDEDAPLTRYVQELNDSLENVGYVAFGSEAGIFQQAGFPSVLCGPGSIAQAHKPDEFVSLEQLAKCESFLNRMISTLGSDE